MDKKIFWISSGDLNAFFGLMLDNLLNLVILTGILAASSFPLDFIMTHMIPGTALGVLFGDLVYTYMAVDLARKEKREDITAMPLGLDTPSTIGIALIVLVPIWKETQDPNVTWLVGVSTLFFIGIVKIIFSFFGEWIRKNVPTEGLIGSIAGIGLTLLCFLSLFEIFTLPTVGLIALGIIFYTLVARLPFPYKVPGAFASVIIATVIYHLTGQFHFINEHYRPPSPSFYLVFPHFTFSFLDPHILLKTLKFLPIAIPFGILTIVGGINVTESARLAGDNYSTRNILLTEAVATIVAAFFGGVSQSTPYIGHPAYKSMGARGGYTLFTGIFIGLGGLLGYVQFVLELIPSSAVTPILVFVGLEIVNQAYKEAPPTHFPAVTVSFLPIIAELIRIVIGTVGVNPKLLQGESLTKYNLILILAHGFIFTGMLWGGTLASLIDRKFIKTALFLLTLSFLTFFGVIHSVDYEGSVYLPWRVGNNIPYILSGTYLLLAICLIRPIIREINEKRGVL